MSGLLFLGIVTLVCAADIAIALHFLRRANGAASEVGAPPAAGSFDPAAARRVARILLIGAPLMWLLFLALALGLFGPVDGITPIRLSQAVMAEGAA